MRDPRVFQVLSLATLLGVLLASGREAPGAPQIVLTIGAALLTQAALCRLTGVPFDSKSPLISGLSLCLLLRTGAIAWVVFAAVVAIASKFFVRVRGKHVFNPTNLGIVAALLVSDAAWVSPGQWGSAVVYAFGLAALGAVVVRRAERADVTYAFLLAYVGLLFGRALWLGDPLTIPLHRLCSGGMLIFAFFMISDPKTTPDRRFARVLYAVLVAGVAYFIRFVLFQPNDLIWALVLCAPLVPALDRVWPSVRYVWPAHPPPAGDALRPHPREAASC